MKASKDFQSRRDPFGHTLLMLLVCLIPIFLFFLLMLNGVAISPVFFFLFIAVCFIAMYYMMGASHGRPESGDEEPDKEALHRQNEFEEKNIAIPNYLNGIFQTSQAYKDEGNLVFEGELLIDSDSAYKRLNEELKNSGTKALLQEDDAGRNFIIVTPNKLKANLKRTSINREQKIWINALLFILTFLTTTWAGAGQFGVNLLKEPGKFSAGFPYSLPLLLILGVHEFGHYFAARKHNIKVTLPYFIPVPFALGTFGAFIQMKSIPGNRKALFDVGIAGPLAGLVIAIPALIIGIQSSTLIPLTGEAAMRSGTDVGSSILFALIAKLTLGQELIAGHTLQLSPLAFAGWLGLLLTALNLIPVGQLDGGHVAHALFGRKNANTIGVVAMFSLLLLGLFVWSGLITWAIIVFFLSGIKSAPPLNDITKLDNKRTALGLIAFIILFLILIPLPHSFYQSLGIYCPYV